MKIVFIDINEYFLLTSKEKKTLKEIHTKSGHNLPSVIGVSLQGNSEHKINETISIKGIDYMVADIGKVVYDTQKNEYLDSSMNIFVKKINEGKKEFVFSTEGIYSVEDIDPRFIDVRGTDSDTNNNAMRFSLELPSKAFGKYKVEKDEVFKINMTITPVKEN